MAFSKTVFAFSVVALLLLLATTSTSVLGRFFLQSGHIWLTDLALYTFSTLVPLSILIAFIQNSHVRAGLLKSNQNRGFKLFELGMLVCIPVCAIVYFLVPDTLLSWQFFEQSSHFGGLPGYFAVKTFLPLSFLAMSGICMIRIFSILKSAR